MSCPMSNITASAPDNRVTYGNYLKLEELLSLQSDPTRDHNPSNDEMHFIITHQTFELWFKQMNREIEEIINFMNVPTVNEEHIPVIVQKLERCSEIFRLLSSQWKVMETLQPQDFLAFRDTLGSSSGFESWQLRTLEMLLGLKPEQRVGGMDPMAHIRKLHSEGKLGDSTMQNIVRIDALPSLNEVVMQWLARTPVHGTSGDLDVLREFVDGYLERIRKQNESIIAHKLKIELDVEETIRAQFEAEINHATEFLMPGGEINAGRVGLLFIESYRELPLLSWPRRFVNTIVDLDESLVLFRCHHARMVERMIGRRMGTGGSRGVDYLDETLKYRIFTDLWTVRTILIKRSVLPDPMNVESYNFNNADN